MPLSELLVLIIAPVNNLPWSVGDELEFKTSAIIARMQAAADSANDNGPQSVDL